MKTLSYIYEKITNLLLCIFLDKNSFLMHLFFIYKYTCIDENSLFMYKCVKIYEIAFYVYIYYENPRLN